MSNWSEHDVLSEAWLHLSLHDLMASVQSWGECWHQKRYLDTFLQIRISFLNNCCLGFFWPDFLHALAGIHKHRILGQLIQGQVFHRVGIFFITIFVPKNPYSKNQRNLKSLWDSVTYRVWVYHEKSNIDSWPQKIPDFSTLLLTKKHVALNVKVISQVGFSKSEQNETFG